MVNMLAMESRVRAHPEEMVNVQVRRLLEPAMQAFIERLRAGLGLVALTHRPGG